MVLNNPGGGCRGRTILVSIVLLLRVISLSAQDKVIRIASEPDYPPFCIEDDQGNATGFSVDLFRASAEAMGYEVDVRVGPWVLIKQELADGKIDALPLVGRSPQRERIYDFTIPYHTLHGAVFVRKGTDEIHTLSDLRDHTVLTMRGDNAEEYLLDVLHLDRVMSTLTFQDAFTLLASGEYDAVVAQRLMGLQLLDSLGIRNIVPLDIKLEGFAQDFSFAVQEGNKELLSILNEGLSIVIANGTYDRLHKEWFSPIMLASLTLGEKLMSLLWIIIPAILLLSLFAVVVLRIELNRRTRRLRETEDRYRIITENLDAIIWEYDVDSDSWTYVSPQSEEKTGYAIEEWTNLEFWKNHIHPEDRAWAFDYCMAMSQKGEEHTFEYRFERKDGNYLWLRDSVSVNLVGGKPTILRGFMSDITEKKTVELEIVKRSKERELILKETYHRMKNNFANIENLISLQAMDSNNDNLIKVLDGTISRVKSMRVLFEKLLISKDLSSVSPKEYFRSLIDEIIRFFSYGESQIEFRVHIENIDIPQRFLFTLGIIINELMTNVMKYAFEPNQKGLVEVLIVSTSGPKKITIRDSGGKLPPNFDIEKQTGFGLQLVRILTHQLNCPFDMRKTAEGTVCEIILDNL